MSGETKQINVEIRELENTLEEINALINDKQGRIELLNTYHDIIQNRREGLENAVNHPLWLHQDECMEQNEKNVRMHDEEIKELDAVVNHEKTLEDLLEADNLDSALQNIKTELENKKNGLEACSPPPTKRRRVCDDDELYEECLNRTQSQCPDESHPLYENYQWYLEEMKRIEDAREAARDGGEKKYSSPVHLRF